MRPALLVVSCLLTFGASAVAVADVFAPVGGSGFTAFRVQDGSVEFVSVDAISGRRLRQRGFDVAETVVLTATPVQVDRLSSPLLSTVPALPAADPTGTLVAVLDTGVDTSHPWFADHHVAGRSFAGSPDDTSDPNGHGTHVAGIVLQSDPSARILPVRVLNGWGGGTDQQVSAGIVWAVENGAKVINLSLGSSGRSQALDAAVEFARSRDVVVVAAAGNSGEAGSPVMFPAAHELAVAVGAVDDSSVAAPFSNRGSYVDVAAPGVAVVSSLPGGGFGGMSGTSMATPHVAGVFSRLRALRQDLDATSVIRHVENTSRDVGDPGRDDVYGWGVVDASRATAEVGSLAAAPSAASAGVLELRQSPRPGAVVLRSQKTLASVRIYVDGELALESSAPAKQWRLPLLEEAYVVVSAADAKGRLYEPLSLTAHPKPVALPKVSLSRSAGTLKVTIKLPPVAGKLLLQASSEEMDVVELTLPRPASKTSVVYEIPTVRGVHWGVLACLVVGSSEICSEYETSKR